jgi:hypothetical protein
MVKDSIYRAAYKRRENRLHLGYDYKGKILKNTISPFMLNVNVPLTTFINKLDSIVYDWVEAVKQIKIFANPFLDKYEDKIN